MSKKEQHIEKLKLNKEKNGQLINYLEKMSNESYTCLHMKHDYNTGDNDKILLDMENEIQNEILWELKGQLYKNSKFFTLQNIGVWKESFYNQSQSEVGWYGEGDHIMVNRQIWCYDDRYCGEGEFVPKVWECPGSFDEEKVWEHFVGDGFLNEWFGLETDDLEVVFLTQEERDELSLNPIGEMGINKRRLDKTLFKTPEEISKTSDYVIRNNSNNKSFYEN